MHCLLLAMSHFFLLYSCHRNEYVDLYVDCILNRSVHSQFTAFNDGFHKVCGGHILVCVIVSHFFININCRLCNVLFVCVLCVHAFIYMCLHLNRHAYTSDKIYSVCSWVVIKTFYLLHCERTKNLDGLCLLDHSEIHTKFALFQELFHPQELQALVIGNEDYDFHELEKVAYV